jgi:hypothetical protein
VRGSPNNADDKITFEANGTTFGVSNATVAVCASGTDVAEGSLRMNTARGITLIATGRARATAFLTAAATNCNL